MCSKMLLRLLVFVCMLLLALCPGESEGEAKKLQIGVKKRPEECPIKTKPGDRVHMHYKVKDGAALLYVRTYVRSNIY